MTGKDAVCCCKNGKDGASGHDGRDSTVPGPRGEPGRDGRDAPDLSTLRAEWRQDLAAIRTENAELKLMLKAMLECNTKAGEYVTWLVARTAKIRAEQAEKWRQQ
jgi:hypothetical protein